MFVIIAVFLQKFSLFWCFLQNFTAEQFVYEKHFPPHKESVILFAAVHGRPYNGPEEQ